jgi:hypothetical protein
MKARLNVSLGGWEKRSVSALAVAIFFWLSVGQLTSSAGQPSAPATQGELLQWMVHLRGDEASMPAGAHVSDYIQWARRHKIEPKGGWHPEAVLTREVYAEVLAQLFGLDVQKQNATIALEKEGVEIPQAETVTRATVVSVVDNVGFQSEKGLLTRNNTTKIHGNNGVGNGVDPAPPGNPPTNDGTGTGPGNPGNNAPHP